MGVAEIVAIAGTIVLALLGAIGKLWHALNAERARSAELLERERQLLERERVRAAEQDAKVQHEHKRDLRKALGWPTSLDPPPLLPPSPPPPLIRDTTPKPPRPAKSPRK